MVIRQSAAAARIAEIAVRTYKRRKLIAELQALDKEDTEAIKEWMAEEGIDVLDLEGAPPCQLKTRSTGLDWDSHAISVLIDQRPQEWRKLVELGAVNLRSSVIRLALKNGNLAAMPLGGHEGTTEYLTFEDKR